MDMIRAPQETTPGAELQEQLDVAWKWQKLPDAQTAT